MSTMKHKNIPLNLVKRVFGTVFIPVMIYTVIYLVARTNGITYFGDSNTWRNIFLNFGLTATVAYALGLQIKNGRYDFSGGAIMTLGALISLYIVSHTVENAIFYLIISIIICTALSTIVSLVYVKGKIPIIICTVGMAIFYESLTLVFNRGQNLSISNNPALNYLGRQLQPMLILVAISALIYLLFNNFTSAGKKSQLLASNQTAAVNIGINEKKNVIITFMLSGTFYGIASVVYAGQSFQVEVVSSVLGTVSTAFGSMLTIFMGFWIGQFSTDAIGIIFSSFAVGILQYGIEVLAPTGYAGAFKNIVMALFMIVFYLVSRKGPRAIRYISNELRLRKKENENAPL